MGRNNKNVGAGALVAVAVLHRTPATREKGSGVCHSKAKFIQPLSMIGRLSLKNVAFSIPRTIPTTPRW